MVRESKQKLAVEASRSSQCGVNGVQAVCGSDDHHLAPIAQTVHEGQQGGHDGAEQGHENTLLSECY